MPIHELSESFKHGAETFQAIWAGFDEKAEGFEPGRLTKVYRILVLDDDAERLKEGDVIKRLTTGRSYLLRPLKMSGIGLVEIDLHPMDGRSLERTF